MSFIWKHLTWNEQESLKNRVLPFFMLCLFSFFFIKLKKHEVSISNNWLLSAYLVPELLLLTKIDNVFVNRPSVTSQQRVGASLKNSSTFDMNIWFLFYKLNNTILLKMKSPPAWHLKSKRDLGLCLVDIKTSETLKQFEPYHPACQGKVKQCKSTKQIMSTLHLPSPQASGVIQQKREGKQQ